MDNSKTPLMAVIENSEWKFLEKIPSNCSVGEVNERVGRAIANYSGVMVPIEGQLYESSRDPHSKYIYVKE